VLPQFGALLMVVTDDSIKIFIVQVSLKIVTYDCQNNFMVQATGVNVKPGKTEGVNISVLLTSC
jgi:hypothetical protein